MFSSSPSCRLPRAALLLATALAAGLAACGDSGEGAETTATAVPAGQRGVLETVDVLQTASRQGDGRRICDEVFTAELAASVEEAAGRGCPAEVRDRLFTREAAFSVERGIKITGKTATATIREQDDKLSTLSLKQIGDRWQIDRIAPKEAS